MKQKVAWGMFAFLALGIGLYPLIYLSFDTEFGLLSTKTNELLTNRIWKATFITHISFGGLALMLGWVQFSPKIRTRSLQLHRMIGFVYISAVLLSGFAAVYIALQATGGAIAKMGFSLLAYIWLFTTIQALLAIRNKDLKNHQKMMIYSYAGCFAAVTLRLWLPILNLIFNDFIIAYQIVAWLSWVPNLFVAHWLVQRI